jgi:hypothetical protein
MMEVLLEIYLQVEAVEQLYHQKNTIFQTLLPDM